METSLSCIQSRIIAIAHFFINESQKNEIFFEKYLHLESYLTILRKHKELLGDAKYNRYLELEYYVTDAAIKSAINLDDFNRKHKFPSELLLELDDMDFDISKCREVQEITGCSMVENNIAAKTIRSFWENSNMLKSRIIRLLSLAVLMGLVYFLFNTVRATYTPNLSVAPDSLVFTRGCVEPDSSCFRILLKFPVVQGKRAARIQKMIAYDYLKLLSDSTKVKGVNQFKEVLTRLTESYDSAYLITYRYFLAAMAFRGIKCDYDVR